MEGRGQGQMVARHHAFIARQVGLLLIGLFRASLSGYHSSGNHGRKQCRLSMAEP